MGNGIPCTQNGLSAWLTHFFLQHHNQFPIIWDFLCLWFQAAAGFHWFLDENQSADLKLAWAVSRQVCKVKLHIVVGMCCSLSAPKGQSHTYVWQNLRLFQECANRFLYHTEMNGNQWLPENVHMVFSWALLVCCFKAAEFCLFRCRSCVFIVYSVRACGSLVGVLVGVLGSCGCPPPASYKAPRQ